MKSIGFYNFKGGCAKTTTAINVAYALAEMKKKVLLVDLDEQLNSFNFFADEPKKIVQPTRYPNLDVGIAENINYEDNAAFFVGVMDRYEIVIFDFPPSKANISGKLNLCNYIFVPLEVGTFSISGMSEVVDLINNECTAKFGGCFAAKYDRTNNSDVKLFEMMKESLGDRAMNTVIPLSKVIKNSVNFRVTAFEYMKTSAVIALADLTEEILERIGE